MLRCASYPNLDVHAFVTDFSAPLGELGRLPALACGFAGADAPLASDDSVRAVIRDLLRARGFRPTGRSKPSSEYLLRAVADGQLGTINAAVDACNLVSLRSGLPISVIDLARATPPLSIAPAAPDSTYVFNASGQVIDVANLLCIHDADGPCANPVKDAQRTKTTPQTRTTLSVLWGSLALPGRASVAAAWYRRILEEIGATTRDVALTLDQG
ncbi:MAG: hypothetical protein IPK80_26015 [Nannocystis sp.]|nr:hypothetical protein [Nannocystis sp.]